MQSIESKVLTVIKAHDEISLPDLCHEIERRMKYRDHKSLIRVVARNLVDKGVVNMRDDAAGFPLFRIAEC